MPNEIPPNNIVAGDTRHVLFHNNISDVLTNHLSRLGVLENNQLVVKGTVSSESNLPAVGTPGDLYFVGNEGDLYGWDPTSGTFKFLQNLSGPTGLTGTPGTIVGLLSTGQNPPVGSPYGSLWFVANTALPNPTVTPAFVGSTAKWVGSTTSTTISVPNTGVQNGDIGVMAVAFSTTNTLHTPAPAGWTLIETVRDTNFSAFLFVKEMAVSDSSFTIAQPDGTGYRKAASMMVFRNVRLNTSPVAPHARSTLNVSTASNTQAIPTVATTVTSMLATFWLERQGTSVGYTAGGTGFTAPSAFTKANGEGINTETGTSSASSVIGAYDLTERATGTIPSGSPTWTRENLGSPTTNNVVFTVALEAL
jgi:hypothetical protein